MGVPQINHLNRLFHYKPPILGYPHLWKPPYRNTNNHYFQRNDVSPSFWEAHRRESS